MVQYPISIYIQYPILLKIALSAKKACMVQSETAALLSMGPTPPECLCVSQRIKPWKSILRLKPPVWEWIFKTLPRKRNNDIAKNIRSRWSVGALLLKYWYDIIILLLASSQIPKCVKASMSHIKCVVLASSIKLLHRFILSKHSCKNEVHILDQS